jgi:hypothetical protein
MPGPGPAREGQSSFGCFSTLRLCPSTVAVPFRCAAPCVWALRFVVWFVTRTTSRKLVCANILHHRGRFSADPDRELLDRDRTCFLVATSRTQLVFLRSCDQNRLLSYVRHHRDCSSVLSSLSLGVTSSSSSCCCCCCSSGELAFYLRTPGECSYSGGSCTTPRICDADRGGTRLDECARDGVCKARQSCLCASPACSSPPPFHLHFGTTTY